MPESPIRTTGKVLVKLNERTFRTELKNGKIVICHLPRALNHLSGEISTSTKVDLDFTPYDMEKGRISAIAHS